MQHLQYNTEWSVSECLHFGGQVIMETLQCLQMISKIHQEKGKPAFISFLLVYQFSDLSNSLLPVSIQPEKGYRSDDVKTSLQL